MTDVEVGMIVVFNSGDNWRVVTQHPCILRRVRDGVIRKWNPKAR